MPKDILEVIGEQLRRPQTVTQLEGLLALLQKDGIVSGGTRVALHDPDTGWLLPLQVKELVDENGVRWLVMTGRYTDEAMGCELIT